jgi:Cft2 family RNA processing exonuclease
MEPHIALRGRRGTMKYTSLGGAFEVGASCHLFQIDGRNILVDAGLRPNRRGDDNLPDFALLESIVGDRLDLILVSHAHIDHTGALPLVHARYPNTPIYCTPPTKVIAEILLRDTIKIMRMQHEDEKAEFPLFDAEDVERTLFALREHVFDAWFEPLEGVRVYFHRSGHIVGAASVLIETPDSRVLYSGDLSVASQRTVAGMTPVDFFRPDALVLEGTYGDSIHEARKEQEQKLARDVAEVIEGGGTVLIPSFALGRAQEILLILKTAMMSGLIPLFPIYVDGLVRAICDAYTDLLDYLPDKLRNFVKNSRQHVFWSQAQKSVPLVTRVLPNERLTMFTGEPKCIIASSGMLVGGPSAFYAKVLASGEKNAIFLTGYQDEESPGRRLLEVQTGDTLTLDGEDVPLLCKVARYKLSAHADQIQLCQQVSYMNPTSVVLVHGEPRALQALREKLMSRYLVYVPMNGDTFNPLDTPEWMTEGKRLHLTAEQTRFRGDVTFNGTEITIRFDADLFRHELWQRFFAGYESVEAKFVGRRLSMKVVSPSDADDADIEES